MLPLLPSITSGVMGTTAAAGGGAAGVGGLGKIALGALGLGTLFGRKRRPDVGKIIRRFRGERPDGYLSAADEAFVGRNRTRALETIGVGAGQERQLAARRLAARGIRGAAAEQVSADITQGELLAKQGAEADVSDLGYRIYGNNRDFEREKAFRAFGAEIGMAGVEGARGDAQQATNYNALLEYLPLLYNLPKRQ